MDNIVMDMIGQRIEEAIRLKQNIRNDKELTGRISLAIEMLANAFRQGNKVLFCGNGGSAADAQHLAAELSGRFYLDRPSLPAEACHVNSSFLTAVANDYGYEKAYARYVSGVGKKNDVLVAISTSGNSENIVQALEQAKNIGMLTIGFTGLSGGKMKDMVDILLNVPSTDTPRIQEAHILIGHIICEQVEKILFG
ncbi:MAG: D-sedoheptulose 7-phosphate isomerase [Prolixibacteraceae bacterium]